MTEIVPGLFLGSFGEASSADWLESNRITHVLNLAKELPEYFPGKYSYKKIPLEDVETCKIGRHFADILKFIQAGLNQDQGRVLVHCMLGISRSATAVIMYLMEQKGMTCTAARQFVKKKRTVIRPNKGFVSQLVSHEMLALKRVDRKKDCPSNYRKLAIEMACNASKVRRKPNPDGLNSKHSHNTSKTLLNESLPQTSANQQVQNKHSNYHKIRPATYDNLDAYHQRMKEPSKAENITTEPSSLHLMSSNRTLGTGRKRITLQKGPEALANNPLRVFHFKSLGGSEALCKANMTCLKIVSAKNVLTRTPASLDYAKPQETSKSTEKLSELDRKSFFNSRNVTESVPKVTRPKLVHPKVNNLIEAVFGKKKSDSSLTWQMLGVKEKPLNTKNNPTENVLAPGPVHHKPLTNYNKEGLASNLQVSRAAVYLPTQIFHDMNSISEFLPKTEFQKPSSLPIQGTKLDKEISRSPNIGRSPATATRLSQQKSIPLKTAGSNTTIDTSPSVLSELKSQNKIGKYTLSPSSSIRNK